METELQAGGGILDTAADQIVPDAFTIDGRKRRACGEFGIGPRIARQNRQSDVPVARDRFYLLDPVGPILCTAEKPDDDQLGMAQCLLDIEVDRKIVLKRQDVREPKSQGLGGEAIPGIRQRRKLAVRRAEEDNIARRLPEVDRLWGVPQRADYHPEVDTGVHLMMVLDMSARLGASLPVRFACLCHDLGKGTTPADVLPRHLARALHQHVGVTAERARSALVQRPRGLRGVQGPGAGHGRILGPRKVAGK